MARLIMIGAGVTPGNQTFSTPGADTFVVPRYRNLTVYLYGAGSGGNGVSFGVNQPGTAGGDTTWNSAAITAGGGQPGGSGGDFSGGAGGTASGGDTNTAGGDGEAGQTSNGTGGDAPGPGGGTGGAAAGTTATPGNDGNAYGGGGSGAWFSTIFKGPGGGAGAHSTKAYTLGDLTVGASISLVVGAGGAGGTGTYAGGNGADGGIYIEWS